MKIKSHTKDSGQLRTFCKLHTHRKTWSIIGGSTQSLYRDWLGHLYIVDHSQCDSVGCRTYLSVGVVTYREACAFIRLHSNWRNPRIPLHFHGILPPRIHSIRSKQGVFAKSAVSEQREAA
jgi:hypothetical protein